MTGENFILKDVIEGSPTYKAVITVKFRPEEINDEVLLGYEWYIFHAELKVYEWTYIETIDDDPLTEENEFEEI